MERSGSEETSGSGAFVCSTSKDTFTERESLAEHYRSDLHRYNLKRKVAGLPPVTYEWFEARREHLQSIQSKAQSDAGKVFVCPVTNKRFQSEGTYESHTRTKKYRDALRKAGLSEPPPPKVVTKQRGTGQQAGPQGGSDGGWAPGARGRGVDDDAASTSGSASEWETDDDMEEDVDGAPPADAADWEEWDLRRSLFDNHVAPTFEKNLEHMYRHYGFHFPDPQCLKDPEGLLRYLGAKLRYGRVALYTAGDDEGAKRFRSLHAVQRHMVDSGRCQMCYDGNEDEYDDFYEYPDLDAGQLAAAPRIAVTAANELVVPSAKGKGGQVLGARAFQHLYRQSYRPELTHVHKSAVKALLLQYRSFGVPQVAQEEIAKRTARRKHERRRDWGRMKSEMANDKIYKLPKNVTY